MSPRPPPARPGPAPRRARTAPATLVARAVAPRGRLPRGAQCTIASTQSAPVLVAFSAATRTPRALSLSAHEGPLAVIPPAARGAEPHPRHGESARDLEPRLCHRAACTGRGYRARYGRRLYRLFFFLFCCCCRFVV